MCGLTIICDTASFSTNVRIPCFAGSRGAGKGWFTWLEEQEQQSMAKKLYVGGLPYSTTDAELREAFSQAGAVSSATIIMDRMSGRSKGFGFVEFANDDDAMKAIDMMNGKEFGGRTLTVNEARPMEPRAPRSGGGGGGGYGGGGGRGGGRW